MLFRSQAIDVLLDPRLFRLDAERYDIFVGLHDHPPAAAPGAGVARIGDAGSGAQPVSQRPFRLRRSTISPLSTTASRRWTTGCVTAREGARRNESRFSRTFVVCEGNSVVA